MDMIGLLLVAKSFSFLADARWLASGFPRNSVASRRHHLHLVSVAHAYDFAVTGRPIDRTTGAEMMTNSKTAWLAWGVLAGLVVGLNVAGVWPQVPLHAVATHGQDTFAICTPMDNDVEGVFVLMR